MRIVSLLSSATEIVHLLGLDEGLVGISHECDFPPAILDRPRVSRTRFDPQGMDSAEIDAAVRSSMERYGSVYEIDVDALRTLRPDLLLTQAVCEVCAVPTGSVREAVAELAGAPRILSLDSHTIDDILQSVRQVADAAGESSRGDETAAQLEARLATVQRAVERRSRPRVLMLEWLDPPFLPGHWVPEMVERAGGECILGRSGARSREAPWQDLAGLDPDVLLIEPCGYELGRARADAVRFGERLRELAPRAIASGASWALDSAYFSRSGPRVVDGVEALAALLHPEVFPNTRTDRIAARWP